MPKKGEIFWEMGKSLLKDSWQKGEFVSSPEFSITDICSIVVQFYPAGDRSCEKPLFIYVRTNTHGAVRISGNVQLCHDFRITKEYRSDVHFKDSQSSTRHCLKDIASIARLKIFHSLPDLCYRFVYEIKDA
ncbi:uncharacterized protein NPIL_158341 [Nephila pilipes]|uniref:Uncharacterized protein n=1 Tax=Nephila pilipes TaxID=299642 RepID=A0A8X6P625_NEPPI|nr:uncharacterized protein NPIL_158341 [Nephila pilipes]